MHTSYMHPILKLLKTGQSNGLYKPCIKVRIKNEQTAGGWDIVRYQLTQPRAGYNDVPDSAFVTYNGSYVGILLPGLKRITNGRRLYECPLANMDAVHRLTDFLATEDVAAKLAVLGKETSHCCFCGTELSNEGSVHYGYGPICAKRFNLPWDSTYDGDAQAIMDAPMPEDF